jgi:hypothetical protein
LYRRDIEAHDPLGDFRFSGAEETLFPQKKLLGRLLLGAGSESPKRALPNWGV